MTTWVRRAGLMVLLSTLVWWLSGCVGPPPTGRVAAPNDVGIDRLASDWLTEPGRVLSLDAQNSWLEVKVYRAGRLARFGHNHLLEVHDLGGELRQQDSGAGVAWLRFRPQRMRVDDPAARSRAGEDFRKTPGAKAIEATRRNLLGPQILDAAVWPEVALLARVGTLAEGPADAELWIGLRGVNRRYQVPIKIERQGEQIRVAGSLALDQSDFGIVPFSVMAGALQVKDQILVEFQVVGRNSGDAL